MPIYNIKGVPWVLEVGGFHHINIGYDPNTKTSTRNTTGVNTGEYLSEHYFEQVYYSQNTRMYCTNGMV